MATGTQVPWTDPGGTPCCCEDECYTDLANQPKPVFVENTYVDISSADYSALYAGGTYAANVSIDVTSMRQSTGGVPMTVHNNTSRHQCSENNVALTPVVTDNNPCYLRLSSSVVITNTDVSRSSSLTVTYSTDLLFARSLGTQAGARKISLASVWESSEASTIFGMVNLSSPVAALFPGGSVFPIGLRLRTGNMDGTVPYLCQPTSVSVTPNLPNATSSVSLLVGQNSYGVSSFLHPCFFTPGHYEQVILGQNLTGTTLTGQTFSLSGSITGFVNIQVVFTPSAP